MGNPPVLRGISLLSKRSNSETGGAERPQGRLNQHKRAESGKTSPMREYQHLPSLNNSPPWAQSPLCASSCPKCVISEVPTVSANSETGVGRETAGLYAPHALLQTHRERGRLSTPRYPPLYTRVVYNRL